MAHFRLPDNFSGNISDALRCMADYHDEITKSPKLSVDMIKQIPSEITLSNATGRMFDEFIDAVQDGKRLNGLLKLSSFDPKVEIKAL